MMEKNSLDDAPGLDQLLLPQEGEIGGNVDGKGILIKKKKPLAILLQHFGMDLLFWG